MKNKKHEAAALLAFMAIYNTEVINASPIFIHGIDKVSPSSITSSFSLKDMDLIAWISNDTFEKLKNKINNFKETYSDNASEKINPQTISSSLEILNTLENNYLIPEKISPSMDNSIIIEFFKGNIYYAVEIFNDGDIVFLKKSEGQQDIIKDLTLSQVKEELNSELLTSESEHSPYING